MRWADNLYDPIQSAQANWGPIGETLQKDASGILTQIPAGRMGTPEEIAAAVLYLSSPEAAYVTGATLHVNGGMAMI